MIEAPSSHSAAVVTVTMNPGLDLTYTLSDVVGADTDLQRASTSTLEASGKGVNVSRTLAAAGVPTVAILPAGGPTGRTLVELLEREGVAHHCTPQESHTRINTSVLRPDAVASKVNGPGGRLEGGEQRRLVAAIDRALADHRHDTTPWLAVCGSLPPGAGVELVREVVRLAHRHGARCAADLSGEALRVALEEGVDLAAPNHAELGEVCPAARTATSTREIASAVGEFAEQTGVDLLVTLGADGALHADGRRVRHASAPGLSPTNPAGAGDALLAGWLAGDLPEEERLARAVRWGRSACLATTTVDLTPGLRDEAAVTVIDLTTTRAQEDS